MNSYTKGEWKLAKGRRDQIMTNNGILIAQMPSYIRGSAGHVPVKETEANANLIAAAPDMYEALKGLLSVSFALFTPEYKAAREALTKAEGKQQ